MTRDSVKEYLLNNIDELLELTKEMNSYKGCFEWADTSDIEELCEVMNSYDMARAIIYGDVRNVIDPVRFNGYGNLETCNEYDLKNECESYIEEILDELEEFIEDDSINSIEISSELDELINE